MDRTTPPPIPPTRPHRDLVTRPVRALAGAVRRAPRSVVAVVVAVTITMTFLAGQAEDSGQSEGMMPDVPEVAATETITERFGDLDEEVVQIVVRSDGDSLVGAGGYAAAAAVEDAIRASSAAGRVADTEARPGIITWAFPAQQALAGVPPGQAGDAEVRAAYAAAMEAMPPEHAGMAAALLPAGVDPGAADRALALVFIDTTGLDEDPDVLFDEVVGIQSVVADAVAGADLPDGVTTEVFSSHLLYADSDEAFEAEIGRLFGSAFAIIVLILAFVYWVRPGLGLSATRSGRRSFADVLLSMATIVMAIVWMNGAAVLLGPDHLGVIGRMTEFSQVIPILLIGLGVDYAIHLTSRYREELGAGASVPEAVGRAASTVGGALVLATVTTALGFMTNVFNPIPALRDFGILSAVGIVAAFVLMLTFVPAMRLLLDRRAERAGRLPADALGRSSDRVLPRLMGRTAVLAEKVPVATLAATVVLAGAGLYGMTQLETRFSSTDFVPDDSPALATIETLTEDFGGGYGDHTDVLVTGDVTSAEVHNELVAAHHALADVDGVVVHGGRADADSPVALVAGAIAAGPDGAPSSVEVARVAEEVGMTSDLTVPAGADVDRLYAAAAAAAPEVAATMLASDATGDVDSLRMRISTTADEDGTSALMADLAEVFAPLEAAGVEAVVTSPAIQNEVVVTALQDSQASSLAITLVAAMLLLTAVFAYEQRRPALGVLTTVPVALVVLWTFGMMAATGIPFGPITATIAALAIGIGLPYAIHVTHRFTEDRERHADVADAIRATVRHAGGAMAGSAFTTMAGFGILVTSSLVPFRQLGAVTVYAVGFSLAAATLVLPSLLVLWDRWHRREATPAAAPRIGNRIVRVGAATIILVCLTAGIASAATDATSQGVVRSDASDRIDTWIEERMSAHDIPGAAVAVVEDGEVVHLAGYGDADPDGTPATPDTPFLIGSSSKPFTAMVIRQLVQEGRLALDEPVLPYLAPRVHRVPSGFERVTVHQLLTHTGGLSMAVGLAGTVEIHGGEDALTRRVGEILDQPLVGEPGESFEYSNAGPTLLAAVAEQVTGQPFADLLHERVFAPLGMSRSFASGDDPLRDDLATGHRRWFGRWVAADLPYDDAGVAMGYIGSSARDLASFLQAHLDGHPAVPATADRIAGGPVVDTGWDLPLERGHGLGWSVDELAGQSIVSHPGSLGHFTAHLVMAPDADLGIAVVSNASSFIGNGHEGQYDLSLGLTRILLEQDPEPTGPDPLLTYAAPALSWAIAAGLVAAAVRFVVAWRRRRSAPPAPSRRRPGLVSGIAHLVVGAAVLLTAPIGAALHFYPDVGWAFVTIAYVALGGGILRLVLAAAPPLARQVDGTRRIAVFLGLMFLTATATFTTGDALVVDALSSDGSAGSAGPLRLGVALQAVNALAVAAIGAGFVPVLRRFHRGLAFGHFAVRILECLVIIGVGGYMLAERTLVNYEPIIYVFTGAAGLMFTSVLLRSGLIAPALARLGMIGYVAILAALPVELLDIASLDTFPGLLLYVPGGLFELMLPILLITRGFRRRDPSTPTADVETREPALAT